MNTNTHVDIRQRINSFTYNESGNYLCKYKPTFFAIIDHKVQTA